MRKSKLSKLIASSVLILSPVGASAEWRQNSTGWWYAEGSSYATGWRLIDGKYYYFSDNGYMLHDTYIDGYELGSDGAWVVSTPRVSTATNYSANLVNLQIVRGLDTSRNLLSCTEDGTVVDLWTGDDGSGRQKWRFTRVNGYDDVYNIRVVNGVNCSSSYLSSTPDGTAVDLWPVDDGSGRQRWKITPISDSSQIILI
ncbi:RICIN domain-containing protein [Clostridium sp.]|uniref:RICIN domain-containing protein n=1 Tax=Clostridium sp. TaxID=1506 RepID=UPI002850C6EA|nr:RICIN domain-containing protein [Clostridium sp.]MDR3596397.1 RICIN domain-containing protein [Clostridium sp.]